METKNKGVLPKAIFPQMLKIALGTIKSLESNVKSRFILVKMLKKELKVIKL